MIRLAVKKKQANYRPGEIIDGVVQWEQRRGDALEVRLVWYTESAGGWDSEIVAVHKIKPLETNGRDAFQFTAPHRPNSYSGKQFLLQWAIEAFVFPGSEGVRMKIVISPTGTAIVSEATSPAK